MQPSNQPPAIDPLTSMEKMSQLEATLRGLKLKSFSVEMKKDLEVMPPAEQGIVLNCLDKWAKTEKADRRSAMITSKIRTAKFKRIQTVENYDFSHSKATQGIEKSYLALYRKTDTENLPSAVFSGNAGLGKTHLARALGYGACQKGLSVLFTTASEMVNYLMTAMQTFKLEQELKRYRKPHVLIIDELGYVTLDAQASNLFFQVISARHDQGLGTIATTNLPFGKFNQIFANDAIAHAIVDRLVNDAEVFYMEGTSYREHQRKSRKIKK